MARVRRARLYGLEMNRAGDLVGKHFGRLTVLERTRVGPKSEIRWICKCDCGSDRLVSSGGLMSGKAKSCGCYRKDVSRANCIARCRTHGKSRDPIFGLWKSMLSRCGDPSAINFANYGGAGIKVCDRWLSFENFYADMGDRPPGMTLDRIDNHGNYSPDNCRWAMWREQTRNKSTNRNLTANGRTMCITDWAAEIGISAGQLGKRINEGWTVESAVSTPSLRPRKEQT